MRGGRGEGEEGKVSLLTLPPFFASLLPLFLSPETPNTQAKIE